MLGMIKGAFLINMGNYDEGLKCYDKALEIDPNYQLALNNKVLALNNKGDCIRRS